MFISLKFDVVCLYSNRLWLHHLCIYCSCATEETLCQCSDRPLEITFPRWPYLLPCIFFNELHPRSVLPFFYCQDADDTQWAFLPRFWMFLLNSMYDDSSSAASSNVLLYLHSTNECVHIDATMLPFPPALLITWILHSIAMVSCSSCWFYHQIYSLTEWHIFATRSLPPPSRMYFRWALMSWWNSSQKERTIAACHAVIRLVEFSLTQNKVYMPNVTTEHITMAEFLYVMSPLSFERAPSLITCLQAIWH